ncbi:PTS system glucitol/sorbitol-specific EIIA component [Vibrio stylophorae]|uniref:PTS system glucitol/sorbitol-specific EIIA component n=1 Tax=Vibrio stylophorae TaxID=659351 RepID=A0ABN8DST5_9VIBR|nr:PTS glucitol/sorbitol transporter subunit IIA [Vibrio stylophorae]CAH0533299.1 PTS system glucitol/sorbitol-specific EIIA component [Vibrio stylophorae]
MEYQFQTKFVAIGESALDALEDDMMILFNEQAPEAVREYCFIHSHSELKGEITEDTTVMIGEQAYVVTAVGAVVNQNLAELGHITLKFDGQRTPELPGTVHLLGPKLKVPECGDNLIFG